MNESFVSSRDDFCVHPCVDGNSSTGEYFNFTITACFCDEGQCSSLSDQPGATMISPIILSITGITGQIAALVYLHRSSRPSNHKTTFYVMLATLIWTDLIGKLITTPIPVLSYAHGHWVGGAITCNLHGYAMSMIGIVTHLLVAAMALERYLGIRCGYFYNRAVTVSRTRTVLIGIWLFGAAYCSLPFIGIGEFKLHFPGSWCHINQHVCWDHPWPSIAFANLYSVLNLASLFLIVFCNFIVVGTLLKMRVTKYRPSKSCRQMISKKPKEREIQMVILLVIITITFVCSWAPHDLLMIKNQLWPPPPHQNPILDIKVIRLVSINQIVDPWSYIICRIIFRSKLWGCCRKVLIGKMTVSRRFGSRSERDEGSVFYSINAQRKKFSNQRKNHQKRTSLPNPSEMKMRAILGTDKPLTDKRLSSIDDSMNSVTDQDCKIDLQSCFVNNDSSQKTTSSITLALNKIFRRQSIKMDSSGAENSSNQGQPYMKPLIPNPNLLAPWDPKMSSAKDGVLNRDSRGLTASFHGNTSRKEGCISCGDLIDGEMSGHPLLQGHESNLSHRPTRSNSWCCHNEYTLVTSRGSKYSSQNVLRKSKF